MANFTAGSLRAIDVAKVVDGQGVVETVKARNGVFSSEDPVDIEAFRAFGLNERTDAQVKAQRKSKKTAAEPVVEAPAVEPVREV